jgi:hypothetical protein
MKVCNTLAIIVAVLALSLIAVLTVSLVSPLIGGNDDVAPNLQKAEPLSLHYAVDAEVSQEKLLADLVDLLKIPANVEPSVIGLADLNAGGKYPLVCAWGDGNVREVDVCVYDNQFNYSVNYKDYDGETVKIEYKEALASQNFTKGITATDSLGNPLTLTKDEKSMSFDNKDGTFLVYYNATDVVGHQFSFLVTYEVRYPFAFNIPKTNIEVPASQKNVRIDVDFDGAPLDQINLWVEDSSGKKIAGLYSTITDVDENGNKLDGYYQIILRSYYYAKFAGQTIELSICSDYGKATFYVTVLDE